MALPVTLFIQRVHDSCLYTWFAAASFLLAASFLSGSALSGMDLYFAAIGADGVWHWQSLVVTSLSLYHCGHGSVR